MTKIRGKKVSLISLFLAISSFIFLWSCSMSNHGSSGLTRLNLRQIEPGEMARFFKNVRSPGGNLEAHYLLACYYQERGRQGEAIEEFKKVLLIDPKHVRAWSGMAVSYDLLKDHPRAIECYQIALEFDPKLDYMQNNLGYSHLLQGNREEAISAFQQAIALNGKEIRFHNNLGLAYAIDGQLEKALEEFKLGGDASKAHFNVAHFYHQKGLYQLAQFHYSTALTLDPSFTHARIALKAVNALVRILKPEAPAIEAKEETMSEPFAFGQMAPEGPASSVALATCDTPPVSEHLLDTGADLNAQVSSTPIDSQGRMVPTESQKVETEDEGTLEHALFRNAASEKSISSISAEKPRPQTEIFPLHDSHLKEKGPMTSKRFGIEVSNGNGTNGMARRVGHYLETRGLEVSRLTNAKHFNYRVSKIYYQQGYQEAASLLAGQLPTLEAMEEAKRFDRPNIKIKLLIGKDLISHQRSLVKE
jgi:Flp pilus assembly protein TadD